jgi:L-2-hydroxyglutarate oxidase LhgO
LTETIDCAVVGAGIVGLAVARALARAGREVVVLETADAIGTGISSRHSEVIHAGIYYPKDSLKARTCVRGRDLMYAFCAEHGVEHQRCGKLIVATDEGQLDDMRVLAGRARDNGVDDLTWLGGNEMRSLEPALNGVAALHSPSSGIVDSHAFMLALLGDAEDHGAVVALNSQLADGAVTDSGVSIRIAGDDTEYACTSLINCAGLGAQATAAAIVGIPPETIPTRYLAKGSYFAISGRAPFRHLIYPMPDAGYLGIHLTLDLGGQAKFGPDIEWIDEEHYVVDPGRADVFYDAVRRYWPDLPDRALIPAHAGIRPKVQAPGKPAADFIIQGSDVHGIKGLVNLYGIESPGQTASMAIAETVAEILA